MVEKSEYIRLISALKDSLQDNDSNYLPQILDLLTATIREISDPKCEGVVPALTVASMLEKFQNFIVNQRLVLTRPQSKAWENLRLASVKGTQSNRTALSLIGQWITGGFH